MAHRRGSRPCGFVEEKVGKRCLVLVPKGINGGGDGANRGEVVSQKTAERRIGGAPWRNGWWCCAKRTEWCVAAQGC